MKWTLVYFDDQIANIELWKELLSDQFNVVGCHDALKWPMVMKDNHPHAFMLDVHMPALDGHTLYQKITEHPLYNGCPVFFISGDISDENKIRSYESGGVDFLPRDLPVEEIVLRLASKIKYYLQSSTVLELGNLRIDVQSLKTTINNTTIDLTLLEMRLLGILLRSFPQAISRSEVIRKIWGDDSVKPGTINTHIANLRPKIEKWNHGIKIREDLILIQPKDQ
jgi:two-component system alkaline phosphatase synthesis response regulator PhoP